MEWYIIPKEEDDLMHYGIKGMKWHNRKTLSNPLAVGASVARKGKEPVARRTGQEMVKPAKSGSTGAKSAVDNKNPKQYKDQVAKVLSSKDWRQVGNNYVVQGGKKYYVYRNKKTGQIKRLEANSVWAYHARKNPNNRR